MLHWVKYPAPLCITPALQLMGKRALFIQRVIFLHLYDARKVMFGYCFVISGVTSYCTNQAFGGQLHGVR